MMKLKTWFADLSQREKIMIAILAALLACVVAGYGVIEPLANKISTAKIEHAQMIERYSAIQSRIEHLSSKPMPSTNLSPSVQNLSKAIAQEATDRGFALSSSQAQGQERVDISISSARSVAFFAWVSDLENRNIRAETMSVRPTAHGTISVTAGLSESSN